MAIEETGVKLIAQNETGFVSAMGNSQKAVSSFVSTVSSGTSGLGSFNLASLSIATTVGNLMASAIQSGISAITNMGQTAILSAGRFQEMVNVDEMMGAKVGLTNDQIDGQIDKIRKLGIEGGVAADTVAQFTRYQLDMSKSTNLAREAQDAAVQSNSNSTETLSRLIDGIITGRTEILKTSGIQVDMNKAYDDYAKVLKTSADALTEEEKVQARLNAVLAAGTSIAGSYETAMKDPYKILGTMPRLFDDLAIAAGTPLLDAFGSALNSVKGFVLSMTTAFSPGGTLYPGLLDFGSQLNGLVVNLSGLASAGEDAAARLASSLGIKFDDLAGQAFSWGYNIINQVVGGMLQGAIDSVGVLTQIGNWLGSWFEAHSPPKILPDLEIWGAAAMDSYLAGWTKADFSVFSDISGIIEASMRSTAGAQDTGVIPAIIGSRTAIADAIEQVRTAGAVTDGILSKLYSSAGVTDAAMQKYMKTTLQLSLADEKVKSAQDALNAVTKKYDDLLAPLNAKVQGLNNQEDNIAATQKISQLQMVLTDVNATAADKEQARLEIEKLRTQTTINDLTQQKTAEVAAAQTKLDAATAEQTAIQAQADAAKALIQMQTQENDLTRQQINLLDQLAKAAAAAAKAKAGAGGGGARTSTLPTPISTAGTVGSTPGMTPGQFVGGALPSTAGPANPNAFQSIIDKTNELTDSLATLNKAWAPVATAMKPFTDFIGAHLPEIVTIATVIGIIATTVKVLTPIFTVIGGVITVLGVVLATVSAMGVLPFVASILAIGLAGVLIVKNWNTVILPFLNSIPGFFIGLWKSISVLFTETIPLKWKEFEAWINNAWAVFSTGASNLWTGIGTSISDAWNTLWNVTIPGVWDTFKATITKTWEGFKTDVSTIWTGLGTSIVDGLKKGISDNWDKLISWVHDQLMKLPKAVRDALDIHSPSGVFADIGQNMMAGLARGILDGSQMPQLALNMVTGGMVNGPSSGVYSPPAVNHSTVNNFNMPVYTNNNAEAVQQSFGLMRILAS